MPMVASGMAEKLTRNDVEGIAALARLELSEEEKELFVRQLADILAYAEQIQAIDTSGVSPTSHVLSRHSSERADLPEPSLDRDNALANAPDPGVSGDLFRVPRVIG